MSQIEFAVNLSRRLETQLEKKYQATGKGLHEKVSSVEAKLPADLVKKLRYIATMRNSVVHQDGFVIEDQAQFAADGDTALTQLGGAPLSSGTSTGWYADLKGYLSLAVILSGAIAGAIVSFRGFGTFASALMGLIGGAAVGMWVTSVMQKVLEFVLGCFILVCVLGLAGAVFKLAS